MNRQPQRWFTWLGIGLATALVLYVPMREARRAARESGQRSLLVQAERQLAAHKARHGRYPQSLEGMHFRFFDGADAETLARLEYRTDGKYYRIVTASEFDGREISVCH
jgi:hypothetical protein